MTRTWLFNADADKAGFYLEDPEIVAIVQLAEAHGPSEASAAVEALQFITGYKETANGRVR